MSINIDLYPRFTTAQYSVVCMLYSFFNEPLIIR